MTTTAGSELDEEDGRLRRGKKTREQILNAAIDLFGSKGFAATSMKDLAGAAGIQAPAIYNHFSSKDRILAEALVWILEEFRRMVVDTDDPNSPARDRLEHLVRSHVAFQVTNAPTVRSVDGLLEAVVESDILTRDDQAEINRLMQAYRRLMAQLIDELRPKAGPVLPATSLCVMAVVALCDQSRGWADRDCGHQLDDLADGCWNLVRGMLRLDDTEANE